MTSILKSTVLLSGLVLSACGDVKPVDNNDTKPHPDPVKLYALDCGRIDMLDLGLFDSGGAYDGRTNKAVDTCYLIRHADGDLLWDAGMPDALNAIEGGVTNGPFHVEVPVTLVSQLAALGVTPQSLDYFSISHSHFDHVGNAGQYAAATFIVSEAERAHMFSDKAREDAQQFPAYSALETAKTITYKGNYDVFGDGSVTMIETPGHTPGHSVLKVELANAGTILLTGDLYHLYEAREKRTVPVFNTDKQQTLASMDSFEALAKSTNARVVIQHSAKDYEALPKPPEFLD